MATGLAALQPGTRVTTTAQFGIPARQTGLRKPENLPSATGASRAVVLGQITP